MTRAEVATLVGADLTTVLTDAGMTAADTANNLKEPIDRALRSMGTGEADLATAAPTDVALFEAHVAYQALRTIWRRIGDRMRISVGGDSFDLAKTFENVKALLEDAAAQLAAVSGIWIGSLDLGFASIAEDGDEFAGEGA